MGHPEDCEISASQQQQLESDGWAFPAENAPASAVVDAQKERQEKVAAQAIRAAEAKAKAEARLASALRESERCNGARVPTPFRSTGSDPAVATAAATAEPHRGPLPSGQATIPVARVLPAPLPPSVGGVVVAETQAAVGDTAHGVRDDDEAAKANEPCGTRGADACHNHVVSNPLRAPATRKQKAVSEANNGRGANPMAILHLVGESSHRPSTAQEQEQELEPQPRPPSQAQEAGSGPKTLPRFSAPPSPPKSASGSKAQGAGKAQRPTGPATKSKAATLKESPPQQQVAKRLRPAATAVGATASGRVLTAQQQEAVATLRALLRQVRNTPHRHFLIRAEI